MWIKLIIHYLTAMKTERIFSFHNVLPEYQHHIIPHLYSTFSFAFIQGHFLQHTDNTWKNLVFNNFYEWNDKWLWQKKYGRTTLFVLK